MSSNDPVLPVATRGTAGVPPTGLSSPLAMMLIIPLLVLASGLAVEWIVAERR